jgi:GTPase
MTDSCESKCVSKEHTDSEGDPVISESAPVIAIVGRPNVGKSTLFNCLTKTQDALVANRPGLTRDRKYGYGSSGNKSFIVIDTGGIGAEEDTIDNLMAEQAWQAIQEANIILFMVDARDGLTAIDELIAKRLRSLGKTLFLVLNKIDGVNSDIVSAEFHKLGFGQPLLIAAAHRRGINVLLEQVLAEVPESTEEADKRYPGIKIAIVGRPNVGKSTLINRMLGEERVVVFDEPGTTRDSIFIPLKRHGKEYTLIDTAGVRRRRKVTDVVEKFSVIKTLRAIELSNVVIFLIDAREGIADQDLKLLGFIIDSGRALVIAVNKWDGLSSGDREQVKRELQRRLVFIDYAKWHFISALHGSGVGDLFKTVERAYRSATKELATPKLTRILEDAVAAHSPPLVKGRRVKLRYAHAGGRNPPIIVIHGRRVEALPNAYKRYLESTFRKVLRLTGTPIRIAFKSGENPYIK